MKNGYKIFWTENALSELTATIEYLKDNFTDKAIKRLAQKIESTTKLISQNPGIFPKSDRKNVHKVVILRFNTMYYRLKNEHVEILSFFSNRQNPGKRKM